MDFQLLTIVEDSKAEKWVMHCTVVVRGRESASVFFLVLSGIVASDFRFFRRPYDYDTTLLIVTVGCHSTSIAIAVVKKDS